MEKVVISISKDENYILYMHKHYFDMAACLTKRW